MGSKVTEKVKEVFQEESMRSFPMSSGGSWGSSKGPAVTGKASRPLWLPAVANTCYYFHFRGTGVNCSEYYLNGSFIS